MDEIRINWDEVPEFAMNEMFRWLQQRVTERKRNDPDWEAKVRAYEERRAAVTG